MLPVAGQLLYAWDADDRQFHFTYDYLRRPLTKEATPYGGGTKVLQVMEYGEGLVDDTLHIRCSRCSEGHLELRIAAVL